MFRSLRLATAGLLLLTALAACSPTAAAPSGVATLASAAPAGASAEPSASLAPEDAMLAFAQCMRNEGIEMSDPEVKAGPGGGAGGIAVGAAPGGQEKFQAAMEVCDKFLQQAQQARGEIDPAQLDRMVKFAECMREQGIDMPDPSTDGTMRIQRNDSGSANSRDDNLDFESPEFQAAQKTCQPILGDDLPGGGPGLQFGTESGSGKDPGGALEIEPDSTKP